MKLKFSERKHYFELSMKYLLYVLQYYFVLQMRFFKFHIFTEFKMQAYAKHLNHYIIYEHAIYYI